MRSHNMKFTQTILLGLALLVFGLGVCGTGLFILLHPAQYKATVRIKVDIDDRFGEQVGFFSDPYFIQTTFEIIQSEVVLGRVETNLDLNEVWGRKYAGGKVLETAKTIKMLHRGLSLKPIRNTKLVAVSFTDDDSAEAVKIANAIAEAYEEYRMEAWQEQPEETIKALQKQYEEQEKQIVVMKTNLDELRTTLQILDLPANLPDSNYPPFTEDQVRQLDKNRIELELTYTKALAQLTQLKQYNTEQLRKVLPSVLADATLQDLLDKLHEAEQNFVVAINGNPNSLDVQAVQARMNVLNRQADDRVASLMAELRSKVDSLKAALEEVTREVKDGKNRLLQHSTKEQPYFVAKRQLDQLMEQHRLLYLKIDAARVDAMSIRDPLVQIFDPAVPPPFPPSRDFALGVSLFVVGLFPTVAGGVAA